MTCNSFKIESLLKVARPVTRLLFSLPVHNHSLTNRKALRAKFWLTGAPTIAGDRRFTSKLIKLLTMSDANCLGIKLQKSVEELSTCPHVEKEVGNMGTLRRSLLSSFPNLIAQRIPSTQDMTDFPQYPQSLL